MLISQSDSVSQSLLKVSIQLGLQPRAAAYISTPLSVLEIRSMTFCHALDIIVSVTSEHHLFNSISATEHPFIIVILYSYHLRTWDYFSF